MTSDFASDALYSVLQAFQPLLKSIDKRTIAVRPQAGEDWENLITSIIISEKTVDEVKKEHNKLPRLKNNQVALFLSAVPFDYSIFEGFVRGNIGDSLVSISREGYGYGSRHITTRQFNPLELKVTSAQKRLNGTLRYVLSAIANSDSPQEREHLWDIIHNQDNEAKRLNYSNIFELIGDALRIEISPRDRKEFECTITDPAQIRKVTFSSSSFVVEITKISGLRNLQLNLVLKRAKKGGFYDPVWRKAVLIDDSETLPLGETCVIEIPLEPPSLSPFDLLELKLIHRSSALTLDETYKTAPLQNVVEPFFKVLDAFCPIDEFRKMLLEPENCGKEPQKIFENAIAWLLSLVGFHTIYLGAKVGTSFEVLRAKESRYQIGSADVIAYEDNERLLLVDCDIGALDEKKIQKLAEMRQHFENVFHNGKIEFVAALFSPRAYDEAKKDTRITIVDKDTIERIFEDLARGDRETARSRIA